ncbi:MAG: hypothetical protein J6S14_20765 [Clostridia bacterium]|nr:hypothetical protein [Clostridia bacterium]
MKINWVDIGGNKHCSTVRRGGIDHSTLASIAITTVGNITQNGEYRPYMRDMVLCHALLSSYTDIVFDDLDEMMANIRRGKLWRVFFCMPWRQLIKVSRWVNKMVAYECRRGSAGRFLDALLGLISEEDKERLKEMFQKR